jgi:hypothetical protein
MRGIASSVLGNSAIHIDILFNFPVRDVERVLPKAEAGIVPNPSQSPLTAMK